MSFYIRGSNNWSLVLFQIFGIKSAQEQSVHPMVCAYGPLGEIVSMFDLNQGKVIKDGALWTTCFYLKYSLKKEFHLFIFRESGKGRE